jgi:hypothetical protein
LKENTKFDGIFKDTSFVEVTKLLWYVMIKFALQLLIIKSWDVKFVMLAMVTTTSHPCKLNIDQNTWMWKLWIKLWVTIFLRKNMIIIIIIIFFYYKPWTIFPNINYIHISRIVTFSMESDYSYNKIISHFLLLRYHHNFSWENCDDIKVIIRYP